ncbi:MAG: lipid II flippase MurJ [Acidobacteriota bacterium]|nr:lipid II flippase MurJ [Acidobacteriota bacterium]
MGPVIAGRGVYQLSAYLDLALASLLAAGAVAAMGWAATLYLLPVSLFGMSVAAAELPELSRRADGGDGYLPRLRRSLEQMAFAVVPTSVGYLAFGWLIVGAIYRSGRFTLADNALVALVLAGYTLGLVATTWSRLLQNAFFALGETVVPAKIAGLRVGVSALVAVPAMLALDRHGMAEIFGGAAAGSDLRLGALGLALGSAAGAWVELAALRRRLAARVGGHFLPLGRALALAVVAAGAAAPAALTWWLLAGGPVLLVAPAVVGLYAALYLAACPALGLGSLRQWLGRVERGRR